MNEEEDFKSFQEAAQKALVNVTKTVNQIAAEDLTFFRASNPKGGKQLNKQNERLLEIARRLLKSATTETDIPLPRLPDAEAVDDNWQGIVEVIDNLLEKADVALDEYTGVIKKKTPAEQDERSSSRSASAKERKSHFGPKPQLRFEKPPTNDETTAFKPLLKSKPHSVVSLEDSIKPALSEGSFEEYDIGFYLCIKDRSPLKDLVNAKFRYRHPYEAEINQYRYPDRVYVKSDPIPFKPYGETQATFVDTPEAVAEMFEELKSAKEIAIDLEHHDKHSYVGLVSLMQISTREKDWIVDTLKPWREQLQILNEVFADPRIVKVLHGAHMDMIWLQRDLGLYVVGLFDTFHASRALNYQRNSLAWLLSKFANFEAQKKYQMADWRIRPLPQDFLDYARSDTHFLLYVYDMMRNELIDRSPDNDDNSSLIDDVLEESKKESLQKYERHIYDAKRGTGVGGWYGMLIRTPALFTKEQFAVFRAVHRWRDSIARREDESLASIMQNQALFSVARQMPLNVSTLLGCVSPVSEFVRRKSNELIGLIKEAKSAGEQGPEMHEFMSAHPETIAYEKRKAERKEQHKRVMRGPDLAQVIQHERKSAQDVNAVVAQDSQFWGSTINSNKRQRLDTLTKPSPGTVELRLQVPLPPLTAEIYTTSDHGAVTRSAPAPMPEHEYKKGSSKADDEVFVIRELGRKKKRKASSEPEEAIPEAADAPMQDEEPPSPHQEQLRPETKAERKARRREKKARKLEAKAKAREEAKEEAPFDYSTAPSVLNAKPAKVDKAATKPAFNPYAKLMNAPKGMRKAKKEIAGKSHTFKS